MLHVHSLLKYSVTQNADVVVTSRDKIGSESVENNWVIIIIIIIIIIFI